MDANKPTLTIRQSMEMAWRHYHAGTRQDATMICMRVLEIEPENPDALHLAGVLAYLANQQDEAIALISRAIRCSRKKSARSHGDLALAKLAKGDLAGATASARQAFAISPSYADAHRVLGLVYQRKGKFKEAILEFQRAKKLGLDTADLQQHLSAAHKNLRNSADDPAARSSPEGTALSVPESPLKRLSRKVTAPGTSDAKKA